MAVERIERTPAQVQADLEDIRPQIRAVMLRRLGNRPWLHDDAEQEATVAAWTRLEEGFPKSIAIYNAAQRVVEIGRGSRPLGSATHRGHVDTHRHTIHLQRCTTLGEEYEIEPPDHGSEVEVERMLLRDVIEQALSLLSERDAEVVRLFYLDGYSAEQIGPMLDMHPSNVRTVTKRARARLRPHLEQALAS